ncbi:MAG: hypothetical protein U0324_20355 [Polyangiales bacterium]
MSNSAPRSLVAATTLAACLALAGSASAGTVQVRDDADLLTPAQETQLRASGTRYAFDARVLTDSRFSSRADFDRHVAAQLSAGNMVVVGIDPVHRWSSVHFGTATRIAANRFGAVENAGDSYFRGSRWDAGFGAILDAAQQSVGTAASGEAAPVESRGGFPWRFVIFGLLAVGGIALAVRAFRRAQPTLGGGWNNPDQGYARGPYGGPSPGPGYGPGYGGYGGYAPPGGSGLGTGIAGAALGGLAGYALGNAMAHRGEETHGGAASEGGNDTWDAGGSASGWDDGGGGGGGDFGGGGDAGGGGGDW